uniref:Uncharacterized protein n=1 Tax=Siphoviridae sp. ct2kB26 TaxID=2825317 RepID=A0A8S5P8A7_9CAUD|nr:MAG TPA: hypothetical protein [Siphoviridae sp. ct2kB26]
MVSDITPHGRFLGGFKSLLPRQIRKPRNRNGSPVFLVFIRVCGLRIIRLPCRF